MLCPSCGRMTGGEGDFCIYCGARIPRPITSVSEGDVKRLREQLVPIVNHKDRTDLRISTLWVIIPFIAQMTLTAALVVILLAEAFAGLDGLGYDTDDPYDLYSVESMAYYVGICGAFSAAYLALAVLTYNLVRRHNRHFARERRFRDAIMSFSERSAGTRFQYSIPANAETKRFPVLWAGVIAFPVVTSLVGSVLMMVVLSADDPDFGAFILIILALSVVSLILLVAQFYLFYFLTVEMAAHHRRWMGFVRETKVLFGRAGYTAGRLSERERLPDRSMALYVIVSLLTGVFIYYWWYTIIKDGNEHFRHHRYFEDQLIALLSTRPTGPEDENASISWV